MGARPFTTFPVTGGSREGVTVTHKRCVLNSFFSGEYPGFVGAVWRVFALLVSVDGRFGFGESGFV